MAKPSKPSKSTKPFTPIRRFFFKLELLGKRHRSPYDSGDLSTVISAPPPTPEVPLYNKENAALGPRGLVYKPMRVALQNDDAAEDAVVITALDDAPFCCHEDLLTMPREKLVAVALALNERLPAALAIDVSHTLPACSIRSAVEYVVGLRDVPRAPKAVRLRPEFDAALSRDFDMHTEMNESPPTSPLAERSRALGAYKPRLSSGFAGMEGAAGSPWREVDRPMKRRKVSAIPEEGSDRDSEEQLTPTQAPRLLRAQSHRIRPSAPSVPARVLRSHSLKLQSKIPIDTSFITTRRPTYRYRRRDKDISAVGIIGQRSSPVTKKTLNLRPIPGYRSLLAPCDGSKSTGSMSAGSSSSRMSVDDSPVSSNSRVGRKRKRTLEHSDDEGAVTSKIGGMSMGSTSEMDICA